MFRKITIEVTGGGVEDLIIRLMRAVSEAIRMIFEGDTGVSKIGALQDEQCEIKLEEFDPCTIRTKWDHLDSAIQADKPENIPDRKRDNGY